MGHRGVTPVLYPLKGKLFSYKMLVLGCRCAPCLGNSLNHWTVGKSSIIILNAKK